MATKRIVLLSVLTALGIVLNVMENIFLPWNILPVPGAKLGLANIVFLIVLLLEDIKITLLLSISRVFILAVLTGTVATPVFPLSLGGAALSLLFMKTARFLAGESFSIIGLSIIGAVGHNIGQLLVLSSFPGLFPGFSVLYILLPGLLLMAIPAGIITGWVAERVYPAVAREWQSL